MLFWTALIAALAPVVMDLLKSDTGQQMMAGHQQMMGGLLQNLSHGGPLAMLGGGLFGARQDAAGSALQSLFPPLLQGGQGGGGLLGGLLGGLMGG